MRSVNFMPWMSVDIFEDSRSMLFEWGLSVE